VRAPALVHPTALAPETTGRTHPGVRCQARRGAPRCKLCLHPAWAAPGVPVPRQAGPGPAPHPARHARRAVVGQVRGGRAPGGGPGRGRSHRAWGAPGAACHGAVPRQSVCTSAG